MLKWVLLAIIKIAEMKVAEIIAKIVVYGFICGLPVKENWISNRLDLSLAHYYNSFVYYPQYKDNFKFARVLNNPRGGIVEKDLWGETIKSDRNRIIKQIDFKDLPSDVKLHFITEKSYSNYDFSNLDKKEQDIILREKI